MRSKLIPGKIRPISFTLPLLIIILALIFANFSFDYMTNQRLKHIENACTSTVIEPYSEEIAEADTLYLTKESFLISHYCDCMECCGKTDGITRSGTQATVNRTIAVDPEIIPLGTEVIIDGNVYIAEDTGAFKGYQVDIFVSDHETAIAKGIGMKEVQYVY